MKMVKSLLLGAAVGLAAVTTAHACELPAAKSPQVAANFCPIVIAYDGGTVLKPIKKGDKSAYIPMSPIVAQLPTKGDTFAEANWGIYPDTQEGDAPACYRLSPEYLVSFHAGVGKHSPFDGIDYDHGA